MMQMLTISRLRICTCTSSPRSRSSRLNKINLLKAHSNTSSKMLLIPTPSWTLTNLRSSSTPWSSSSRPTKWIFQTTSERIFNCQKYSKNKLRRASSVKYQFACLSKRSSCWCQMKDKLKARWTCSRWCSSILWSIRLSCFWSIIIATWGSTSISRNWKYASEAPSRHTK